MASFGLSDIGQIAVHAKDLARATVFYRDNLGMQHLFTTPTMSFFQAGATVLMLAIPSSEEFDHPSSVIYFQVRDIFEAHRALIHQGVFFIEKPHFIANMGAEDLWMAFFNDSEGNVMAIRTLVPKGFKPPAND